MVEGLAFARRLGIRAVMVEGDTQLTFDSFEQNEQDLSHTGLVLADAYKTHYVPRDCNFVANKLAKLAKVWNDQKWLDEAPRCFQDILLLDYSD